MAPEQPDQESPDPWLDGLAGRSGNDEGRRLRAALLTVPPPAQAEPPPWSEIERRASVTAQDRTAANDRAWWPLVGCAAVVLLGTAVLVGWPEWHHPSDDQPETALRGVGASAESARWLVANPQTAATALADELRLLGATVSLQQESNGIRLLVVVPGAATEAVNQRLAALETALDTEGKLSLWVQAP